MPNRSTTRCSSRRAATWAAESPCKPATVMANPWMTSPRCRGTTPSTDSPERSNGVFPTSISATASSSTTFTHSRSEGGSAEERQEFWRRHWAPGAWEELHPFVLGLHLPQRSAFGTPITYSHPAGPICSPAATITRSKALRRVADGSQQAERSESRTCILIPALLLLLRPGG